MYVVFKYKAEKSTYCSHIKNVHIFWNYLFSEALSQLGPIHWEELSTLREKCPYSDFSSPYFPAFGLNTDRYKVSLCIQSEYGNIRTRKTPNMDIFHAVRTCKENAEKQLHWKISNI